MERVEVVGSNTFVLRTRQLGPHCWCCDVYERREQDETVELFAFEDFGESEIEAIAMALQEVAHHRARDLDSVGGNRVFQIQHQCIGPHGLALSELALAVSGNEQ